MLKDILRKGVSPRNLLMVVSMEAVGTIGAAAYTENTVVLFGAAFAAAAAGIVAGGSTLSSIDKPKASDGMKLEL